MNQELEQQLVKKYPDILKDYHGNMQETCMTFGMECHDGWYILLDNLLYLLQQSHDLNHHSQVRALQIKEKFGLLCFYAAGTDEYQDGLITMAEEFSGSICEQCGTSGQQVSNRQENGWYKTRCESCIDV